MHDKLKKQEIEKASALLNIPEEYIRKDFYVSELIRTLTLVEDDFFSLVFQGGTCLSKAYKVVSRFSEDVDFRVIQKPDTEPLGRLLKRKKLRYFRYALINALKNTGFSITEDSIRVFYEGRFMAIDVSYESIEKVTYLKPHIAVECFFGKLALVPVIKEVTTIIKQVLGTECSHPIFPVTCAALDETVAEKWVALTRRVSGTQQHVKKSDKDLVRHLYDLHHLAKSHLLTGQYQGLVAEIIEKDRRQFKKRDRAYAENPLKASNKALSILFSEQQWQHNWDEFLEQMVYDQKKPTFSEARQQLELLSHSILEALRVH